MEIFRIKFLYQEGRSQINDLGFCFKILEKERQIKPKVNRKKGNTKDWRRNQIENRKLTEKN